MPILQIHVSCPHDAIIIILPNRLGSITHEDLRTRAQHIFAEQKCRHCKAGTNESSNQESSDHKSLDHMLSELKLSDDKPSDRKPTDHLQADEAFSQVVFRDDMCPGCKHRAELLKRMATTGQIASDQEA
ncbi:hypothetical protein EJ06DRAFT_583480 [Trichodelitschia bisporula]|uniref:Uncharacterized protein n=1 Tax=Trichodelitschia bisporula TaxID=703511 RepID=A0A6G1HSQ9_9PEZI|nr:hypothetical protein EJ06DRAFT_583480 [Trichodelitschia bisporula]